MKYLNLVLLILTCCISGCEQSNKAAKQSRQTSVQPDKVAEQPSNTEQKREIVVASWGGAYQEAQRVSYFEPFMKETGIVIVETNTPDYGKFYSWTAENTASADVVDVETYFVFLAGQKGALHDIPASISKNVNLVNGAVNEFGIATAAYADVIAWNSDRYPNITTPHWRDFWSGKTFKGVRGLRDLPASTLEVALLAQNKSSPKSLYPIDLTLALNQLSDLRTRFGIALWSSGSTPIERLVDGSVDITSAWNGRVYDAKKEGLPIEMTYEGGMLDWLWWVIPKHAKNKTDALKFIQFTLRADRQAEFAKHIPYGPSNKDAVSLLPVKRQSLLPTSPENLKKLTLRDNAWWSKNDPAVQSKWRSWKLDTK